MWFKKNKKENSESIQKILNILDSCHHLVKIETLYKVDKQFEHRFFDMIAGYYWLVSVEKSCVQLRTGDVSIIPKDDNELIKMLDAEITKSALFEIQKQTLLKK